MSFIALQADQEDFAFYIGALKGTGGNFTWARDNTDFTFTNWGTNQPNNTASGCAVVIANPVNGGAIGQWDVRFCLERFGYICEADRVSKVTLIPMLFL